MIELSSEQVEHYRRHGFLVVPDLLTGGEVQAFLDHEALGNAKPGLGLRAHVEDPMRDYVARHPNVADVAGQLLGATPCIVQSMYLAKYAGRSPEDAQGISLHQDQRYLPTEPATLMACWVALSDTDPGNGGLCVVPGSHHTHRRCLSRQRPPSRERAETPVTSVSYGSDGSLPSRGFPDETPPRLLPVLRLSRAARTRSRENDRPIHLRPARPRRPTPRQAL